MIDRVVHIEHRRGGVGGALAVVEGHAAVVAVDDEPEHRAATVTGPLHVDEVETQVGSDGRSASAMPETLSLFICEGGARAAPTRSRGPCGDPSSPGRRGG